MTRLNKGRLLQYLAIFTFIAKSTTLSLNTTVSELSQPPPLTTTSTGPTATTTRQWCRDRLGSFLELHFRTHACAKCLHYLLPDRKAGDLKFEVRYTRERRALLQSVSTGRFVFAHPGNQTAMGIVCNTLSYHDCYDWTACCQAAGDCCQRQLNLSQTARGYDGSGSGGGGGNGKVDAGGGYCPMTWDGFSCVDRTPAGQTAIVQCPAYIKRFSHDLSGSARRQCWSNSSWYINEAGLEWTNYDTCHKTIDHRTILILKLTFKSLSIVLLVPSIVTFLMFRPLRSQLRIKIHINLFLSLALNALFSLLWEAIVNRDLLIEGQSDYFINAHPVSCKFLNIMARCTLMMTFSWMFCEGFYLTWLLLQSFRHLSSPLGFCLFGWGVPFLFCMIYTILRITINDDTNCWLTSAGSSEWLINGPTLACIGMNLVFLLVIMRVMVRQLRSHDDNQSVVVRSLRALLILIPLFGLQQFCIMYRPDPSDDGFYAYEIVSAGIMSLQGAVVALIFCFFNGEVQSQLKDMYKRLRYKLGGRGRQHSRQSMSMTSSTAQPRTSRPSLASIDTVASIVISPLRFTGTATDINKHNGNTVQDESDSGGVGDSGGVSWRIRMARLHEDIAEQVQESDDGSSGMSSSDFTSISENMKEGEEEQETRLSSCSTYWDKKTHDLVSGPPTVQSDSVTPSHQTQTKRNPKMSSGNKRLGTGKKTHSLGQGPAGNVKKAVTSFVSRALSNGRSSKTESVDIATAGGRRGQDNRGEQVWDEPPADVFGNETDRANFSDIVVSEDSHVFSNLCTLSKRVATTSELRKPILFSESRCGTFSENHIRFQGDVSGSHGYSSSDRPYKRDAFGATGEVNKAFCLSDNNTFVGNDEQVTNSVMPWRLEGAFSNKSHGETSEKPRAFEEEAETNTGLYSPLAADEAARAGKDDIAADGTRCYEDKDVCRRKGETEAWNLVQICSSGTDKGNKHSDVSRDDRAESNNNQGHHTTRLSLPATIMKHFHDSHKLGGSHNRTTTSPAIFDDTRRLFDAGFLRGNDSMASLSANESGESNEDTTETHGSEIFCDQMAVTSHDPENDNDDAGTKCPKKFYFVNPAFDEK